MPAFLGLGPDNPITWSNFYRKGGLKSVVGTAGAFVLILAGLIFLSARLSNGHPRRVSDVYTGWSNGLLGLQFLFLVVFGAGRVTACIRGDITSGMAESLRMMPLSARHAIVGYLCSSAVTLGGFFIANFLLGLIVNSLAGLPAQRWLIANGILLIFAIFIWTIAGFMAFLAKNAGGLLAIVSLVGVFGNAGLLYVAPGLVVLAGPLIGGTIFEPRTAQTDFAAPLMVSIAAQFLVGAIFFTGAARKYRHPETLALGGWLALALLLAIIGVSLLAILRPDDYRPSFFFRGFRERDSEAPFSGSTVLALLFALIPLANFARLHVGYLKGRMDDPEMRRPVPPPAIAALIVTGALALMIFALPEAPGALRLTCILSAFFGFSMSVIFVAAWFYRAVDNAKIIISIWLILYCLIPLGVDFARDRFAEESDAPAMTIASTFSPVGMIIEAANDAETDLRPGAIFHMLIPLLPLGIYLRSGQQKKKADTNPLAIPHQE